MNCKRIMRQIPLAVGQDLGVGKQRSFDEHLRRCLPCYREFRDYTDALAALDPLRAPADFKAPAGLAQTIIAELRANQPGPLAPHPTPIWSRSSRALRYGLPLAAAFAIFALAGIFSMNEAGNPGGESLGQQSRISMPPVESVGFVESVESVESLTRTISAPPHELDFRDDQLGPAYVFPERFHPGRLRLVGPVSSRRSDPLPHVIVPISKRNDF